MKTVQDAFEETTKLIFGRSIGQIEDYEDWLDEHLPKMKKCTSTLGIRREVQLPGYTIFKGISESAVAGSDDLDEAAKLQMRLSEDETFESIRKKLGQVDKCIIEFAEGHNQDVMESTIYFDLSFAYRTAGCFHSKYLAYTFWLDKCEHLFGGSRSFDCSFSIGCYNSKQVNRSFEVDFCKNCSDIMFCHNCENVRNSLFCFNVKNKRYAICNQEVGKEAYLEVRAKLVERILKELETKHALDMDIYSIGRQS